MEKKPNVPAAAVATAAADAERAVPGTERDAVRETVEMIAELHRRHESRIDPQQKGVERFTGLIGRPRFLHLTLAVVVLWICGNLLIRHFGGAPPDAPPFVWLQGAVTLGALVLTTAVLITQYRQDHSAERRAQLDLQISIVIEQKVTKLIALVEELRRDLPNVQNRYDPEAEMLTQAADVASVVEQLNELLDDAEQRDAA